MQPQRARQYRALKYSISESAEQGVAGYGAQGAPSPER